MKSRPEEGGLPLNLLVSDGRLPKDHLVDCRLIGKEEALAISLAENSGREAMHPFDLVMAYRNLIDASCHPQ
jgi:ParB family chromosome partitioning protein